MSTRHTTNQAPHPMQAPVVCPDSSNPTPTASPTASPNPGNQNPAQLSTPPTPATSPKPSLPASTPPAASTLLAPATLPSPSLTASTLLAATTSPSPSLAASTHSRELANPPSPSLAPANSPSTPLAFVAFVGATPERRVLLHRSSRPYSQTPARTQPAAGQTEDTSPSGQPIRLAVWHLGANATHAHLYL